jgi:hypothetical protein
MLCAVPPGNAPCHQARAHGADRARAPRRIAPAVEPDAEDAEALALLREVAALLDGAPPPALAGEQGRAALAALQELAPLLPELAPGLGATGARRAGPSAVRAHQLRAGRAGHVCVAGTGALRMPDMRSTLR